MARALALAVALVAMTAVRGVTDPLISAGSPWRAQPERAHELAAKLGALRHFGGASVAIATEAYDAGEVAMFVTELTGEVASPGRAARIAIHELTPAQGPSTNIIETSEAAVPANHTVVATSTWIDLTSSLTTTRRTVLATDGKQLTALSGECLSGPGAPPASVEDCKAKLATLEPRIAVAARAPLVLEPPGAVGEHPPAAEGPRLSDGSHLPAPPMPPMVVGSERSEIDRRPIYIGAGLVVLAVAFWWNRRQRERFDPESDEDADSLHAAARGEPPKDDES
ncbi:MAG: hypothetical protein AB7P03_17670 [Kofleriaceae bacterium]